MNGVGVQDMELYGATYSAHVRNHIDPNVAIGGGNEEEIGLAQATQLVEAGVLPGKRLLEVGFGTGRIWHGIPKVMDVARCTYFGIDVVEALVPPARERVRAAGIADDDARLEVLTSTSQYPRGYEADAIWGYSVFTHMEMEDVYVLLSELKSCAASGAKALFTFLPLEHAFGRQMFLEEAGSPIPDRYNKIRNVAVTQSMAEAVATLAGWRTLGCHWAEHPSPIGDDGVPQPHQSWLLLEPQ